MDKEDVIYRYTMEYYSATKRRKFLPFETTCNDLGYKQVRQRKTDIVSHLYVEPKKQNKKIKLTDTKIRLVVARTQG